MEGDFFSYFRIGLITSIKIVTYSFWFVNYTIVCYELIHARLASMIYVNLSIYRKNMSYVDVGCNLINLLYIKLIKHIRFKFSFLN